MSADDGLVLARQTEFNDAVQHGDFEKVKAILDKITNEVDKVAMVNCPSQSGSTALFTCCWYGHYDVAELLILNGAKINWKNLKENTAVAMAIEQNHVELVRLLLQNGAQAPPKLAATIRTNTKKTIDKKIDKMLEDAAAYELKKSNDEKVSGILNNPLGLAVLKGDAAKVKQLLHDKTYRALVQETDTEGNSILFVAAEKGYPQICELLLDHGAELDLKNKSGNSPLHMAIAHNHFQTTKLLLERGANTYGVSMRYIRYWSPCNISKRIDSELKKYPPKEPSIQKKNSPLTHLTPKEIADHKAFFDYYDTNRDGYITFEELNDKLGPKFGSRLVRRMMVAASSAANNDKISFEDFVAIQKEWDKERVALMRAHPLHPLNASAAGPAGSPHAYSPAAALGGPKGYTHARGAGAMGQGAGAAVGKLPTHHPRMYVSAMTAPGQSSTSVGALLSSSIAGGAGAGAGGGTAFVGSGGTFSSIGSPPPKPTHSYAFGTKYARHSTSASMSGIGGAAGAGSGRDGDVKQQPSAVKASRASVSGATATAMVGTKHPSPAAAAAAARNSTSSKTAAGAYPTFSTFGGPSAADSPHTRGVQNAAAQHKRSPSAGSNHSRPGSALARRSMVGAVGGGLNHKLAFAQS